MVAQRAGEGKSCGKKISGVFLASPLMIPAGEHIRASKLDWSFPSMMLKNALWCCLAFEKKQGRKKT
jgi:hypothetical protein